MKPANFPERINRRRKGALARLADQDSTEARVLQQRIKPSVRDHRSKKSKLHLPTTR